MPDGTAILIDGSCTRVIPDGRYKSAHSVVRESHDDFGHDNTVLTKTEHFIDSMRWWSSILWSISISRFNLLIAAIICSNVIFIGLEIDLGDFTAAIKDRPGWYAVENIFLIIFCIEIAARMRQHGRSYFRDSWNTLDSIIVASGILETWILSPIGSSTTNSRVLTLLRVVRLLRLGRLAHLLRPFKELWLIIMGVVDSLKTLGWVSLLLLLVLYVCAIFTTLQIGQDTATYGP